MTTTIGSLDLNSANSLYNDATQYFWFESDSTATYGAGVHITLSPSATFMSNPTGQNILINTDGISIRNGLLPMMTLDNDSLDFNMIDTTLGTYTTLASFGLNGVVVQTKDNNNNTVEIAQLGYGSGNAKGGGTANAPYYTIGERATPTDVGNYSVAGGLNTDAKGAGATAFGYNSGSNGSEIIATGLGAMVFGDASQGGSVSASNDGAFAHGAAGKGNLLASGIGSHAEGDCSDYGGIKATGKGSHAEGLNYSTSPSNYSIASGDGSHVEGGYCQASGAFAHAEGFFTKASSNYQHAQGKYNVEDTNNTYAVIVGNGTADNARSNAFTVDWSGNVNIARGAKYKINGTNLSASDVSAVALNGGTMTGQLLTSYKSSVAMGSYGSAQTTVGGLVGEVRYSSGCAGSANITTAYTADGVTISTGWYNFMYMPHRSGGKNGSADGDNANYGNLFLFGMNNTNGRFIIRVSNGSIQEVSKIITTIEDKDYVTETGSNGIWKYRKWSSGRIECWGEKSWSNVACTTSAGGGYRSADVTQALPSGLFTAIDSCQATMKGSGGNGYTMALRTLCTTTTISQMFWNTSNATKSTCIVDYYIIGT